MSAGSILILSWQGTQPITVLRSTSMETFPAMLWSENIGWINFGLVNLADYYVVACKVTFEDLANFVEDWLGTGPGNLDGIGDVDFNDYSIFASYWLDYCPDNWPLK